MTIIPIAFTLTCSRCDAVSDAFDDAEERDDVLDREGWQVREGYPDLCPSCMSDLDALALRRPR